MLSRWTQVRYRAGTLRYSLAGLALVVFWLLVGEIGVAMRDRAVLLSGLELLRRYAASDTTVSVLLSALPVIVSVLLMPLIGQYSDHLRSAGGRRRPLLLVLAPLGTLALCGLAASPMLGQAMHTLLGSWSPGLDVCHLGVFFVFWTGFECAALSALVLYAALVNDVLPKSVLGRFFAAIRIVGLGAGIAFNMWVLELTDDYLLQVLLGIGLLFGATVTAMCLMVREGRYPELAPLPAGAMHNGLRATFARAHLDDCRRLQGGLWVFGAFMLASVAFSPFNTFYLYYALQLGIPKAELGAMTAAGYSVSIALALVIGSLVDRYGAVRMALLCMAAYALTASAGYVAVHDADSFRLFFVCHIVMSGAYLTASASLPMTLFPRLEFMRFMSTKEMVGAIVGITVSLAQGRALDLSGHDYHLTLLTGAAFSVLCTFCLLQVERNRRRAQTGWTTNPPRNTRGF
jgi:MFS family permease